jgi:hypothetical protein
MSLPPIRTRIMSNASTSSLRRALTVPALLGLALGSGCSASADIPEVVVTRTDIEFLGVPNIPGAPEEVSTRFEHPSDFEIPDDLNPKLRPIGASVTGRDNMDDLSFLRMLRITLSSEAPGAPPTRTLAYYERPTSGRAGRTIKLQTNVDSDVLSYWDTDQAYYEVTLAGTMPTEDWSIDVTFSFDGSISVSP